MISIKFFVKWTQEIHVWSVRVEAVMVFIVLKVFIVNVNDFRIRWQLSTQVQLLIIRTQYFNWYELPGFFRRKHDYLSGCFCGGTINNYFKFITGNWFTIISCYIDACRLDKIVSVFIKWESPDQCVMWSRWVVTKILWLLVTLWDPIFFCDAAFLYFSI